ncbi:unnamed protein product [Camellia sinensis]
MLTIRKHATALVASGLFEEAIDPTVASQKSVFAVGMICCEEEGRLKEKPVLLQSRLLQQVLLPQLTTCSLNL